MYLCCYITLKELDLKSLENSVGLTSASVYKDLSGLLTYASRKDAFVEYNRRINVENMC